MSRRGAEGKIGRGGKTGEEEGRIRGEREREWEGVDVRLPVVEFGVWWPAGVENVGGGPVGVEGTDGLEEGGDGEEDAAGGEEGCHEVGLVREGGGRRRG